MAEDTPDTKIALLVQETGTFKERLSALERRLAESLEKQQEVNTKAAAERAVLNFKSGAWGAIAGAITVIAALLLKFF